MLCDECLNTIMIIPLKRTEQIAQILSYSNQGWVESQKF